MNTQTICGPVTGSGSLIDGGAAPDVARMMAEIIEGIGSSVVLELLHIMLYNSLHATKEKGLFCGIFFEVGIPPHPPNGAKPQFVTD